MKLNCIVVQNFGWLSQHVGRPALFFLSIHFSLETNLRFRGCEVKYWNLPFTIEDCYEFQKVRCVGSETVLANPLKLFIFAIYNTLSCQIFDIVITLVVDETHQSGKDKLLSVTAPKFI